jgi:hypothetical protein
MLLDSPRPSLLRRSLRHPRRKRARRRRRPVLRFSPTAWAKLLFLRDRGETEIGGFGISANDDPLYVVDLQLVLQTCTPVTVAFDDAAVADFFDAQVDLGKPISQVGRIWIHTHPGESAAPSATDEETFRRVFGRPDWAVMFILAQRGASSCRLRFNVGPGAELEIPNRIDFRRPFAPSDFESWEQEYAACVRPDPTGWAPDRCDLPTDGSVDLQLVS